MPSRFWNPCNKRRRTETALRLVHCGRRPEPLGRLHGPEPAGENAEQLVEREGDLLRYRIPKITVAMFAVPGADTEGNLYLEHGTMIAEIPELVRAAKRMERHSSALRTTSASRHTAVISPEGISATDRKCSEPGAVWTLR